jgi:glutamate-1-semialdehyde 2,1-aminomutase
MAFTSMPAGIPLASRNLTAKFRSNDLSSVQTLVEEHPGQIACLILEAETVEPPDNFLHEVQRLAKKWCPPHPR